MRPAWWTKLSSWWKGLRVSSRFLVIVNGAILAAVLWAGWLTNWSFNLADMDAVSNERARQAYADCILENMKGVNDRQAVFAIKRACEMKWKK